MHKTQLDSKSTWIRSRFAFLLLMILFMLAVVPFLEGLIRLQFLFNVFLTAVLASAVYELSKKIQHLVTAAVLAIPMLISVWSSYVLENAALFLIGRICGILFIAFTIFHILRYIFKQQEVTKDTIAGATTVYLLIALMWAFMYGVLERLQPGSFKISAIETLGERNIFIYYSFVTITTLGYGDITPQTYVASALAILEAVIGQLYLVVLVAWLVGMYVSRKSKPM